jgi:hypothetical protein
VNDTAKSLTGGCLCGGVRFTYGGALAGELGLVTVCHCVSCRKAQGYAVAVAPASAADFAVTLGQGLIREFQSSPGKWRAFCGVCGSPLYSRLDARPESLRLRLGAIDDPPSWLRIGAHIFAEDVPAWSEADTAPRYPGREPGRSSPGSPSKP